MRTQIPFDQYQRYKTIELLVEEIRNLTEIKPLKVLEIGANSHKNLSKFLQFDSLYFSDISISGEVDVDPHFFIADATNMPEIADNSYDVTIALDVFEHVPHEKRECFIQEISRISRVAVLMCFPFNTPHVLVAESRANSYYKSISGKDHPWLIEHISNGLPGLSQFEDYIQHQGLYYSKFEHGSIDLWELMIKTHFYVDFALHAAPYRREIDEYYNNNIYIKDRSEKNYRAFYVISKSRDYVACTSNIVNNVSINMLDQEVMFISQYINDLTKLSSLSHENAILKQLEAVFLENRQLWQRVNHSEQLNLDITSENGQLWQRVNYSEQLNLDITLENEQLWQRVNDSEQLNDVLSQHLNELRLLMEDKVITISSLRRVAIEHENSFSWRITKPLRIIRKILSNLMRNRKV